MNDMARKTIRQRRQDEQREWTIDTAIVIILLIILYGVIK